VAKAQRRKFTAEYKLAIVEEADRATDPGEIGSLLRREGLYSSHLVEWRRLRAAGAPSALSNKRGRKPARTPPGRGEREVEGASGPSGEETPAGRDHHRCSKKVSALLGITLPETDRDESN
jgi:transposase-like protein